MRKYSDRIDITFPPQMKAELLERAKRDGVSMSEIVRRAAAKFGESQPQ